MKVLEFFLQILTSAQTTQLMHVIIYVRMKLEVIDANAMIRINYNRMAKNAEV